MNVNLVSVAVQTLGGLALFILGMKMMTDGLQMTAGQGIKSILSAISSNRFLGCLTGAGVTAVVQSSSSTTVMLIGFVGAGMMTLQQAVGVILGANVGTTVTAQMIAFKLTAAALPAIAIGVSMKFFSKKRKYRYIGEIILGFGLLFYGMTVMKSGLTPIKADPAFISFFTKFNSDSISGILLCVAMGAILTVMVQSSSATIGLTMAVATQGLLEFPAAMAMVLGENIGTTITAQLATIGSTNANAHRAANAHTLFNVLGVGLILCIFPYFIDFIEMFTHFMGVGGENLVIKGEDLNISRYIANGHTIFNVVNVIIFLIFLPLLIKITIFLSPKETNEGDMFTLPVFDNAFIDSPLGALANAKGEIVKMAGIARFALEKTSKSLENNDVKALDKYQKCEDYLDDTQRVITGYLTSIYQSEVNQYEADEIADLMRITNNIERIGDCLESTAKMAENMFESNLKLSKEAQGDLKIISEKVMAFFDFVMDKVQGKEIEDFYTTACAREDEIDQLRETMRHSHIKRLRAGSCSIDGGIIFISMLSYFERMGDYCFNIGGVAKRFDK